jgi:hypothetical protein
MQHRARVLAESLGLVTVAVALTFMWAFDRAGRARDVVKIATTPIGTLLNGADQLQVKKLTISAPLPTTGGSLPDQPKLEKTEKALPSPSPGSDMRDRSSTPPGVNTSSASTLPDSDATLIRSQVYDASRSFPLATRRTQARRARGPFSQAPWLRMLSKLRPFS